MAFTESIAATVIRYSMNTPDNHRKRPDGNRDRRNVSGSAVQGAWSGWCRVLNCVEEAGLAACRLEYAVLGLAWLEAGDGGT